MEAQLIQLIMKEVKGNGDNKEIDALGRQIVTVEDALTGGCNLFDIEHLQLEYSPAEYQNLLMCDFVDDEASVFPFAELQSCMIDRLAE